MERPHRVLAAVAPQLAQARLTELIDRWNRRRGGVIVAFHDISSASLTRNLSVLAQMYCFVSLTEMVERLTRGRSTLGLAVVTFDDGDHHVVESAAVLAVQRGWPMTFFLPTASVDLQQPSWYRELRPLFARSRSRTLTVNGRRFLLGDDRSIVEAANSVAEQFKLLDTPDQVDRLLRLVRRQVLGSEERPADLLCPTPISWERVRELARRDELSFEAHSVNHLALSRLGDRAIREEMTKSRARIEEVTQRPVQHFCYPYGSPADIGTVASHVARTCFRSAVTMQRGRCRSGVDLALLPRIPLYEQDSEHMVTLKVALGR